jgi:hypothetical protein
MATPDYTHPTKVYFKGELYWYLCLSGCDVKSAEPRTGVSGGIIGVDQIE